MDDLLYGKLACTELCVDRVRLHLVLGKPF